MNNWIFNVYTNLYMNIHTNKRRITEYSMAHANLINEYSNIRKSAKFLTVAKCEWKFWNKINELEDDKMSVTLCLLVLVLFHVYAH